MQRQAASDAPGYWRHRPFHFYSDVKSDWAPDVCKQKTSSILVIQSTNLQRTYLSASQFVSRNCLRTSHDRFIRYWSRDASEAFHIKKKLIKHFLIIIVWLATSSNLGGGYKFSGEKYCFCFQAKYPYQSHLATGRGDMLYQKHWSLGYFLSETMIAGKFRIRNIDRWDILYQKQWSLEYFVSETLIAGIFCIRNNDRWDILYQKHWSLEYFVLETLIAGIFCIRNIDRWDILRQKFSLTKPRKNAETILKTYEIFIYGSIQHFTN
jgi:hypothetical protein